MLTPHPHVVMVVALAARTASGANSCPRDVYRWKQPSSRASTTQVEFQAAATAVHGSLERGFAWMGGPVGMKLHDFNDLHPLGGRALDLYFRPRGFNFEQANVVLGLAVARMRRDEMRRIPPLGLRCVCVLLAQVHAQAVWRENERLSPFVARVLEIAVAWRERAKKK
ncbi:hypothetical protein B0H11DRAFT_1932720 [Mycena galericulata]|nr:hypothetical protein B0H11DRAFT_1932720 [Mycena galericulata]